LREVRVRPTSFKNPSTADEDQVVKLCANLVCVTVMNLKFGSLDTFIKGICLHRFSGGLLLNEGIG